MIFLDFLKENFYENMLQNALNCTIKTFFSGETCPRTPLANAWLQAPPPNNSCPPWQILHTPMNYY